MSIESLGALTEGMPIVFGGDRVARVSRELASAFSPGDSVLVVQNTGGLLHVPRDVRTLVDRCVGEAAAAFAQLSTVSDGAISGFFSAFADNLANEAIWHKIAAANRSDVEAATKRGRSTTRLIANENMRAGMIEGLRGWIEASSRRGQRLETVEHNHFHVELMGAALGVIGFVFEGRPNVLADATGVLRGGNAVVFRIGSDALGTAQAIMELALTPALEEVGLPRNAVMLVPSPAHAAGWALFSDARLSLAVARGSGPAVATLGALAQQAGVPVSLHGTGGAWMIAAETANVEAFEAAVFASLDRKVCNTLNTCCIVEARAGDLVPALLRAMERAGKRTNDPPPHSLVGSAAHPGRAGVIERTGAYKLHAAFGTERHVPSQLFATQVSVQRASGPVSEPQVEPLPVEKLGEEWEWEQTPEVSLIVVRDVAEATALFNRYSPHFVATLISDNPIEHDVFFAHVDAPFVGDGFTRWVDGQYALRKPELGLSNWQFGRLLGRGGILSGDSVFTVRTRYVTRARTT